MEKAVAEGAGGKLMEQAVAGCGRCGGGWEGLGGARSVGEELGGRRKDRGLRRTDGGKY